MCCNGTWVLIILNDYKMIFSKQISNTSNEKYTYFSKLNKISEITEKINKIKYGISSSKWERWEYNFSDTAWQ